MRYPSSLIRFLHQLSRNLQSPSGDFLEEFDKNALAQGVQEQTHHLNCCKTMLRQIVCRLYVLYQESII